jgi:hypothetical protein
MNGIVLAFGSGVAETPTCSTARESRDFFARSGRQLFGGRRLIDRSYRIFHRSETR